MGVGGVSGFSPQIFGPGQGNSKPGPQDLSKEDEAEIAKLKQRDQEVRQHEQAHLAAAGPYARGGANFSYTTGPDGKRYASGGEVSIDVGEETTPEATLRKMAAVKRAAVAPAEPSPQDRAVYAEAAQKETEARQELAKASEGGGEPIPPDTAIAYQAAIKAFRDVSGE